MSRNEDDLRTALTELEARADRAGAPPAAGLIAAARSGPGRPRRAHTRWLLPLTAAAAVAIAAAVVALVVGNRHSSGAPAAGSRTPTASHTLPVSTSHPAPTSAAGTRTLDLQAAGILEDAAKRLDAAPAWTAPAGSKFYYVHTTMATTWTSVSGRVEGRGHNSDGERVSVPGCAHGRIVATGESGTCTLDDVPHYRADAPTSATAWDAYLERIAPGAKAAGAQGKIIVQVLHGDLLSPRATAALLRYTATCPGLRTVAVRPVSGQELTGVTCTSMTAGSYGLVFDAGSHRFTGFVLMDATTGKPQHYPAEIILKTKIVSAPGQ